MTMHTLRSRIADEVGFFSEPDIDRMPRMWCECCRKRTPYRYDQFDVRECLECNCEEEVCHADEA